MYKTCIYKYIIDHDLWVVLVKGAHESGERLARSEEFKGYGVCLLMCDFVLVARGNQCRT